MHFHMILPALLLMTSFFPFLRLIIFIAGSLNDSQNFFHVIFTSIYIIRIAYALNDDIVDIEKPDIICLLTFVVDKLSGLFSHPSIFSMKHPRQMMSYQIFDIDGILIF